MQVSQSPHQPHTAHQPVSTHDIMIEYAIEPVAAGHVQPNHKVSTNDGRDYLCVSYVKMIFYSSDLDIENLLLQQLFMLVVMIYNKKAKMKIKIGVVF